ncbi:putative glucose-6-phosphate 1-epimerase [Vitis vinifera]|uniref:Putative glucose-6-phosphate 1-epimerase n=1 Tax=Vitis vinifera TaxID=29760 RepID=A0A438H874_VITVI|nr:putative glucose-6-phosphate 1-epimerase [Vitis vinifera]
MDGFMCIFFLDWVRVYIGDYSMTMIDFMDWLSSKCEAASLGLCIYLHPKSTLLCTSGLCIYLYPSKLNIAPKINIFCLVQAIFKPPKAIRGGIPICFPQFGNHGSLEQHGFARNRVWSIDVDPPPFPTNTSSRAFIDLILKPSEEDMKIWPHSYEFRLRVALGPGGDLMLTSRIRNTSTEGKPLTFTFAYHTYFSVSDIRYLQT